MVLQMTRPYKHPRTGVYYFRQRTPSDLRTVLGDKIVSSSLRTKDPAEAKLRHPVIAQEQAIIWERHQTATRPTANAPTPSSAGRPLQPPPRPSPRNGARRCAIRKAPRQPPLPNPPKWAKLKPGVSLTLDKSWGQRQGSSS